MRQTVLTYLVTDPSNRRNRTIQDLAGCGRMTSRLCELLERRRLMGYRHGNETAIFAAATAGQSNTLSIVIVVRNFSSPDAYTATIHSLLKQHYRWASRAQVAGPHITAAPDEAVTLRLVKHKIENPVLYRVLTQTELEDIVAQTSEPRIVAAKELKLDQICEATELPRELTKVVGEDDQALCYVTQAASSEFRYVRLTYPLLINGCSYQIDAWIHRDDKVYLYDPANNPSTK
jgi:hypothetical protein